MDETHQKWIQSSGCGCKTAQANHLTAQRRAERTARASSSPNHRVQMAHTMRGQNSVCSLAARRSTAFWGKPSGDDLTHMPTSLFTKLNGSSLHSLCMCPHPLGVHTQSFDQALFCSALPDSCIQKRSALQQTHQNKAPAGAKSLHGFALIAHWLEQAHF